MDPLQTQTLSAQTSADIRGHSADTAILPLQASKSCPEQTLHENLMYCAGLLLQPQTLECNIDIKDADCSIPDTSQILAKQTRQALQKLATHKSSKVGIRRSHLAKKCAAMETKENITKHLTIQHWGNYF